MSCPESGTSHHGLGPTQELGEDMTDMLVVLESGSMGHYPQAFTESYNRRRKQQGKISFWGVET